MAPLDPRRLHELIDQALDVAPAERDAWLAEHCPDPVQREQLRAEISQAEDVSRTQPGGITAIEDVLKSARPVFGDLVGVRLGNYLIEREIVNQEGRPEGGMSNVYLARRIDGQFDREVAIKVIRQVDGSDRELDRFRQEQHIVAELDHPNIVRLLDAERTTDGRPYFIMEYVVEGRPITQYANQRDLTVPERIELFLLVCDTVAYCHERQIVHGDLKPTNILVDAQGQPKVLDFGVANREGLSGTAFTPQYASPEQHRQEPLRARSDVYTLGVILYELLTGTLPYEVRGARDRQREVVCNQAARLPSESALDVANPELSEVLRGELDDILMRALEKSPADRYASVEEFRRDLQRYLDRDIVRAHVDRLRKTGTPMWYLVRRFLWQYRRRLGPVVVVAAAVAVVLILSVGSVAVGTWRGWRQERARAVTERLAAEARQLLNSDEPRLAGLLAVAAWQRGEAPVEALAVMARVRQLLRRAEGRQGESSGLALHPRTGLPWYQNVAFRADGSQFAVVTSDGIRVGEEQESWRKAIPEAQELRYGASGRRLAVFDRRKVQIVDTTRPDLPVVAAPAATGEWWSASEDGRWFAVMNAAGELEIRTLENGALEARVRVPNRPSNLQFQPGARGFVTLHADGVRMWRLESGGARMAWSADVGTVTLAAFSQRGEWLAVAFPSRTKVSVLRSLDGGIAATVPQPSFVNQVLFRPERDELLVALADGSIRLWSISPLQAVAALYFDKSAGGVQWLRFSADGDRLVAGNRERSTTWDLREPGSLAELPPDAVRLQFSPDSEYLTVEYEDSIRWVRVRDRKVLPAELELPGAALRSELWFSEAGEVVAVSRRGTTWTGRITERRLSQQFPGRARGLTRSGEAVLIEDQGHLVVYRTSTGEALQKWTAAAGQAVWLGGEPDSVVVAAGDAVQQYRVGARRVVVRLPVPPGDRTVRGLSGSPSGRWLGWTQKKGDRWELGLYDRDRGEAVVVDPPVAGAVELLFSPDDTRVALRQVEGERFDWSLWRLRPWRREHEHTGQGVPVGDLVFGADGKVTAVVSSFDKGPSRDAVVQFDPELGRETKRRVMQSFQAAAFRGGGEWVFSVERALDGSERRLFLFDTRSGRPVWSAGDPMELRAGDVSPDGRWVAVVDGAGVRLQPLEGVQLAREVCQLAAAELSQEEWRRYWGDDEPYQPVCGSR
jgi:WD40 repeat protein